MIARVIGWPPGLVGSGHGVHTVPLAPRVLKAVMTRPSTPQKT